MIPEANNGKMSVREFVKASFRDKHYQSELNYFPNTRDFQKKILIWKNLPEKTSYLDPIIKLEKKKGAGGLGPQVYATHAKWSDDMSNTYK